MSRYTPTYGIDKPILTRNLYVDNYHAGADNEEALMNIYNESRQCYLQAGLNLREWITNSPKLLAQATKDETITELETSKANILGMTWRTDDDTLHLAPPKTQEANEPLTKRKI